MLEELISQIFLQHVIALCVSCLKIISTWIESMYIGRKMKYMKLVKIGENEGNIEILTRNAS